MRNVLKKFWECGPVETVESAEMWQVLNRRMLRADTRRQNQLMSWVRGRGHLIHLWDSETSQPACRPVDSSRRPVLRRWYRVRSDDAWKQSTHTRTTPTLGRWVSSVASHRCLSSVSMKKPLHRPQHQSVQLCHKKTSMTSTNRTTHQRPQSPLTTTQDLMSAVAQRQMRKLRHRLMILNNDNSLYNEWMNRLFVWFNQSIVAGDDMPEFQWPFLVDFSVVICRRYRNSATIAVAVYICEVCRQSFYCSDCTGVYFVDVGSTLVR